ncbi:MAG TPA: hypothetical protein PKJ45_09880 [Rubrivivax sp.]|nr:hypothetical protein [Rubrivivax sp.]
MARGSKTGGNAAPPLPRYRPLSRRRRLLLLGVAVATAITLLWLLLQPELRRMQARQRQTAPAPCTQGRTQDCVGGVTTVIVAPAARTASGAPRPQAGR